MPCGSRSDAFTARSAVSSSVAAGDEDEEDEELVVVVVVVFSFVELADLGTATAAVSDPVPPAVAEMMVRNDKTRQL